MKKVMFGLACAAAVAAVADIESSNVVGYSTDTITKQTFNMVAVPFESTDGDGFKLDYCLSGANLTGSTDFATADQVQIWDAATGTYDNWYYYVDEKDHSYDGWWDVITQMKMFEDSYPNGLPAGSSFWYKSADGAASNGTVQFSGQVPAAADITTEILKGTFNMIASPYPTALKLNDTAAVDWSKATGTTDFATADQIQIWDATTGTYDNWFYYVDEKDHSYDGWWDVITQMKMFEDSYPNGLAVGKPFWYKAIGSGTFDVKFISPIK